MAACHAPFHSPTYQLEHLLSFHTPSRVLGNAVESSFTPRSSTPSSPPKKFAPLIAPLPGEEKLARTHASASQSAALAQHMALSVARASKGSVPPQLQRAGHSSAVYKGQFIVFAGRVA